MHHTVPSSLAVPASTTLPPPHLFHRRYHLPSSHVHQILSTAATGALSLVAHELRWHGSTSVSKMTTNNDSDTRTHDAHGALRQQQQQGGGITRIFFPLSTGYCCIRKSSLHLPHHYPQPFITIHTPPPPTVSVTPFPSPLSLIL